VFEQAEGEVDGVDGKLRRGAERTDEARHGGRRKAKRRSARREL
jgi:hypothetical protein